MAEETEEVQKEQKRIDEVVQAIEKAASGVVIPGGTGFKVTSGAKSNTLVNAKALAGNTLKVYPTQVTLDDTLAKWHLDALADSLEPLEKLIIYKFEGGPKTTYLFCGSYGPHIVCLSGSTSADAKPQVMKSDTKPGIKSAVQSGAVKRSRTEASPADLATPFRKTSKKIEYKTA